MLSIVPGPHADHACLGAKCRQPDGSASVYDLPTGSTRCPVCGSRRLTRLFNAVNVGRGMAQHVDSLVEPEVTRQRNALREDAPAAPVTGVAPAEQMQLKRTYTGNGAGMLGMIPGDGRAASQAVNVPLLRRFGGPRPVTGTVVG